MEAAIISSIVCFLVFSILMIAMYLCDLGAAGSYLKETAQEMSVEKAWRENKGVVQSRKKELEQRMIVAKVDSFSLQTKAMGIEGKAEISIRFFIPVVGEWLGKRWKNVIRIYISEKNDTDKLRRWDLLE